jgi:hypothetical protein
MEKRPEPEWKDGVPWCRDRCSSFAAIRDTNGIGLCLYDSDPKDSYYRAKAPIAGPVCSPAVRFLCAAAREAVESLTIIEGLYLPADEALSALRRGLGKEEKT